MILSSQIYLHSTLSVILAVFLQIEDIYKSLTNLPQEEKITKLLMLKLRYFTPKEIANLLGFPSEFGMWDTCRPKLLFIKSARVQ
uniref:cDNA FLJ52038, highly similar to DNA n=1 Tax=Neovison vison TaxID=452646 RepID=U6DUF6_NEOVI